MKKTFAAALCTFQLVSAQIPHDWSHTFGDTTAPMEMHDFFIDTDGTLFVAGQKLPEGRRVFTVSAITPEGEKVFETDIEGRFEEKGLLIVPAGVGHIVAAGFFEDQTGTFNFRTMKLTKSGGIVWNREFGNDSLSILDVPTDLEIDPFGNVVVAGNSHSFEGRYGLVQYSSGGTENWSLRHQPFANGFFAIKDIVIDTAGNIYGITSNSFVNDTTHGTIFKRDKNGNLLWERTFDLMAAETPGDHLLLRNDTIYAAGSLFTEGSVNSVVVCVALTSSGNVASYRRFELSGKQVQQGMRALAPVPGGRLALVNESSLIGKRIVHTFVLSKDFEIVYGDSLNDLSEITATVFPSGEDGFGVFVLGSELRRHLYRISGGTISRIDTQRFDIRNRTESKIIPFGNHVFVGAINFDATPVTSTVRRFTPQIINAVKRSDALQPELKLHPAYPNPFNPSTTISYEIATTEDVSLSLFDMSGRLVKSIAGGRRSPGRYRETVDAAGLASGTYFVRMNLSGKNAMQKIVLIK